MLLVLLGVEPDALAKSEALGIGVSGELSAHLLDDLCRGLADRNHCERRKEERQHSTAQDTGENNRVANIIALHVAANRNLLLEGGEKRKCSKHSGANGEAFASGGGGVSESVERISDGANFLRLVRHLRDPTSVIGNRTVRISGQGNAKCRQHAHGSDGDAVVATKGRRGDNRNRQNDGGWDARDHADTKALDDYGSGSSHSAVLDGDDWAKVERSEVLRELANDDASKKADDDAEIDLHVEVEVSHRAIRTKNEKPACEVHAFLERPHELTELHIPSFALLLGVHGEVADN
mmetsp:Transcript_28782/g.71747  ORF Transcript_28782/g.71747 Transcript_28782/m.71747 type:complete len:293 (-) Transcript_28782:952-1830(-)